MVAIIKSLAPVALSVLAVTASPIERREQCFRGTKLFVVGGTGCGDISQGGCDLANIAQQTVNGLPGSNYEVIQYTADRSYTPDYKYSVITGIEALRTQIHNYADNCPGRIMLLGYSQGANVVSDALAGDGGDGTGKFSMDSQYASRITAAVAIADPTSNRAAANPKHINQGTSTTYGNIPRNQGSQNVLNDYGQRYESYCDTHDPVCSSGDSTTDGSVHGSYFAADHYVNAIVGFFNYYGTH